MSSIVLNAIIAVCAPLAWLSIVLGSGDDRQLALGGVRSLKYYTVLSNLFAAAVSAAYLLTSLVPGTSPSQLLLAFKLAAASTVLITFLVTATLLGPVYGWRSMYHGGNFWLHLIVPLVAAADVCLFAPVGMLPLAATFGSVAFTAIYAVGYLRPVLRYGAKRDGKTYDFYGFLRWGRDKIWLVATVILSLSWAIALLLCFVNRLWGLS